MKKLILITIFALLLTTNSALAVTSSCLRFKHTLNFRSDDENTKGEVSKLQQFLKTQGHYKGDLTGSYRKSTASAVISFQKANKIAINTNPWSSAIVGPKTAEKIASLTCPLATSPKTTEPTKTNTPPLTIPSPATPPPTKVPPPPSETNISINTPKVTINQWNVYSSHTGTNAQATLSSSTVLSTINYAINFQGGPTDGDKRVFVHFVDSNGNTRFQNDFTPATPSSKWTASSSNWISMEVDVPDNIPTGSYTVYAGLYNGSNRVKLNPGSNVSADNQTRYKVGTVTISPAPVTSRNSSLVGSVIGAIFNLFGY